MSEAASRMTPKRKGGLGMAEFRGFRRTQIETSVGSSQVHFFVEPCSWLRRRFRWWFYWVGDEARFRIGVKGKAGRSLLGTLDIYEDLPRPKDWQPNDEPFRLVTNPYAAAFSRDTSPPKRIEIVGSRLIDVGMARYMIGYPGKKDTEVIVTFEARSKETLIVWLMYFACCVVSTLLGGIVGGLLGYWMGKDIAS